MKVPPKTATLIQHRWHQWHSTSLWFLALMSTSSSRPRFFEHSYHMDRCTESPLPSSCYTAVMLLFPNKLNIQWYWCFYLFVFTPWFSCIDPYIKKLQLETIRKFPVQMKLAVGKHPIFDESLKRNLQKSSVRCQKCWWWEQSLRPKFKTSCQSPIWMNLPQNVYELPGIERCIKTSV